MFNFVKNEGQVKELVGKSKYLIHVVIDGVDLYAKPGLEPIFGLIFARSDLKKLANRGKQSL